MIKAVVTGAAGRMGGKIISLISATESIRVVGAVEVSRHPIVGRDIGQGLGLGKTGILASDKLSDCIDQADVVIDFTNPCPISRPTIGCLDTSTAPTTLILSVAEMRLIILPPILPPAPVTTALTIKLSP